MKRLALRSALAVAMVTCLLTTSQAGVIPWVYDAIFGPVRYPAYGPAYASPGYAAPGSYYSQYRCSPCSAVSYRPASPCSTGRCSAGGCSTGRCSTGGCSTVAYYPTWPIGYAVVSSPCSTKCSTPKTNWKATDRRAPEPRDEDKTTFADEKDPFNANKHPQPAEEVTPVKPEKATIAADTTSEAAAAADATASEAAVASESADGSIKELTKKDGWEETSKKQKPGEVPPGSPLKAATPAEPAGTDAAATATEVVAPKLGTAPGDSATAAEEKTAPLLQDEVEDKTNFGKPVRGEETPAAGESTEASDGKTGDTTEPTEETGPLEVKPLEVKQLPDVQEKASWKFSRPARRIAFRASFGNVQISRIARNVNTEYVIPAESLTRIAER